MQKNKIQYIISVFLIVILLQSCQYFEKKVPNEKELLEKRLQEINWDEVDDYPFIETCDSIDDKESRKQCFFNVITDSIQQRLIKDKLYIKFPKVDTLSIKVTVFADSNVDFETQPKDSLSFDKTKMDSILKTNLVNFPTIHPALKRGIPVKTNFILPIKLKLN